MRRVSHQIGGLAPEQATAQSPITWKSTKLTAGEGLAVRASKKLRQAETLVGNLGATVLRKHLDDVPLWRSDHVPVRQVNEDFAQYLYLPRVTNAAVIVKALQDGVNLLTWRKDTFAYAESLDEKAGRYRGLRSGCNLTISEDDPGLLVKPDIAGRQMDAETASPGAVPTPPGTPPGAPTNLGNGPAVPARRVLRRFYGSVSVDPGRVGRDAGRIADEIIAHLSGQVGADVKVTIEIEASLPNGATDQIVRTVTENARSLKFTAQGFEEE